MKIKNVSVLVWSVIVCQMAGIIGAFFTSPAIPYWYAGLVKPSFNPPSWLFGPVWTLLYLLMGISLYLVWIAKRNKKRGCALKAFGVQLGLNSLWSVIFFGLQLPWLAFGEIVILWLMIGMTIYKQLPVSKVAAYLMLPYLAWVSFASVLNLSIAWLN
jgi:translocator protein